MATYIIDFPWLMPQAVGSYSCDMESDPILFIQDLAVILIAATLFAWLCRRMGLSPVVGYLLAGLVVGTPEIVFPYVTDEGRIKVIAQLGVVFLMFSIGLQFRLQRIRELGLRIIAATMMTALLVVTAARLAGDLLGLSEGAALALAAIFVSSSSAIISKVLQERGLGHERFGQLALGMTLMEDVVAVVMLAILGSYLMVGSGLATDARDPLQTVFLLAGFAVLVFTLGILIVPRVLRSIGSPEKSEAMSLFIAATLFLMALVAVRAGYSLALGAFLCGMIVAETRQKPVVERLFRGLKDIFLTIFFVTIGMMIDITAIPAALHWILLGAFGALFGRALAVFVSLVLVGEHPRTAFRAALCLTPLGEFAFIIAGFAVAGGLFSETFQVAAVGAALVTSLVSPVLAAQGDRLSRFLAEGNNSLPERIHMIYGRFWEGLGRASAGGMLWPLLRKRLWQAGLEILMVSTVLLFADPLFRALVDYFGGPLTHASAYYTFWVVIGVLCLIPLLAVWRNLSAVALILADYSNRARGGSGGGFPLVSIPLKTLFGLLLLLWFWNIIPVELPRAYLLGFVGLIALVVVPLAWRQMIRWHSEVEWALDQSLRTAPASSGRKLFEGWQDQGWDLSIDEFILPDDTAYHGSRLMDTALRQRTGCSIVGIERHGQSLRGISPTTHLFAGDELLLLGTRDQVKAARELLERTTEAMEGSQALGKQVLESLKVDGPPVAGQTLAGLNWSRLFGVQVVAIRRDGKTLTSLDHATRICKGDTLLLLGSMDALKAVADASVE